EPGGEQNGLQAELRYQANVCARPSSRATVGSQPSSSRILAASSALARSSPLRNGSDFRSTETPAERSSESSSSSTEVPVPVPTLYVPARPDSPARRNARATSPT